MDSGKIKKGLGRGLSSLIGETKSVSSVNKLSVSDLISNKFQPRKIFDGQNLEDSFLLNIKNIKKKFQN